MTSFIERISIIDKHLKSLVDDVPKKHPEMILNWRELAMFSKDPLPQRIIDDSKKISCFIELMNLCVQ